VTETDGTVHVFDRTVIGPWQGARHLLGHITDRNGRTTTLTYDAQDRLVRVEDHLGNALRFAYDANNKLVRVSDPLGRQTTFSYTPDGSRLVRIVPPDGTIID